MCDGESMFVESCPGGTMWDDYNKACVWPDMQGVITYEERPSRLFGYGQKLNTLPVQRPLTTSYSSYGKAPLTQVIEKPMLIEKPIKLIEKPVTKFIEKPTTLSQDRFFDFGSQQMQFADREDERQTVLPTQHVHQQFQAPQNVAYGSQQQVLTKPQTFSQPITRQQDLVRTQQYGY